MFSLTFSDMVISNDKRYGAIGVVFSLMTWLIAIGVVIIPGAVVGIVWRDRGNLRSASEAPIGPALALKATMPDLVSGPARCDRAT